MIIISNSTWGIVILVIIGVILVNSKLMINLEAIGQTLHAIGIIWLALKEK